MTHKQTKSLLATTFIALTSLITSSCVELAAVALMSGAMDKEEERDRTPAMVMHEGPLGKHPIARAVPGTASYIYDPYTNNPVIVIGKPAGSLLKSGFGSKKKFYIPRIHNYPVAKPAQNQPGFIINPYDDRTLKMDSYKPGSLVASPTAGSFFYLPF